MNSLFDWGTGMKFSVKSMYIPKNMVGLESLEWWKRLWSNNLHKRIKFLLWKLANFGLPQRANLGARGVGVEENCLHGCEELENEFHLFVIYLIVSAL